MAKSNTSVKKGQFDYTEHILPNGLTVLLYPYSGVDSFYVRALVRSGRGYETVRPFGISHFVEHYVHQGSKKYPDQQSFRREIEKKGMMQNASTGHIFTDYWIKGLKDLAEDGIDLLHELVAAPCFPADRLKHVREVILNEYEDAWQSPERKFYYYFFKKLYTDEPYITEQVIGTPEDISSITREDCQQWYAGHYTASNIILTVSGNIDPEAILKKVEETWSDVPKGKRNLMPDYSFGNYSDHTVYHFPEDREQITFALSFPSFGELEKTDLESAAFRTGAAIMGGGMLSRLFQKLREEHNYVYRIGADAYLDFYRGEVRISGMCMKENLEDAMKIIFEEVKEFVKNGVTEEELEIHKNRLASRVAFRYESYESVAEFLDSETASLEKTKRFKYPHDYLEDYMMLTVDDIHKTITQSWDVQKVIVGLFGNISSKEKKRIGEIFQGT